MTTLPRGIWASWFRRLSRPPLRGRPAALEQSLANLNTRKRLRCLVTAAGTPPPAIAVTVGCPHRYSGGQELVLRGFVGRGVVDRGCCVLA